MALHFHLGSSGAGKTTVVQNMIIKEAEAEKDRSFLFVVPEQFTLQTQRRILSKSSMGGMYNIDALSFNRLCFRVFEEQGLDLPAVLEDTGKSMIVKKVALEHRDELTVYKSKVKKPGFIEEMKSLIAEFYQYRIDRDRFGKMKELAGDRRILKAKLHDIEIIYDAFAKFIENRFVMNEELIDRMCDIAGGSELIKDSVIVFDGFTGFTPSQYNCINSLMKYCRDIHVILTIGKKEAERAERGYNTGEDSLFGLSIKTMDRLEKLATENNIPYRFKIYDTVARHKDNPSLMHLERNIFRFPYSKSKDPASVTLLSASDIDEEADFITAKIRELVLEDGKRFEDIAVLAGDISAYGSILERKFITAGIPVFIDEKHSISGMNLVEFIDSVIETELTDYSYESVFRLLKTGFTDADTDDIARAENYVIAYGVKGYRRWGREWKKDMPSLDRINRVREEILKLLSGFKTLEKKEPTVTERLTAIYGILESCGAEMKLYEISRDLKTSTDPAARIKGMEIGQLFKSVITVFERINALLGDEHMDLREFKDVLDTGFDEAKLRSIPGGADSVVVGDIERTRIENKKIIFLAGCNDSAIPKNNTKEGLLNEFDRELFEDNEIELSPTKRENAALSEFYLYLAMTKPSEKLYITYSRMSGEEKEARPAYLFARVMKLYEGLSLKKISEFEKDNIYRILGNDRGLSFFVKSLRAIKSGCKEDEVNLKAYKYLKNEIGREDSKLLSLIEEASDGKRKALRLTEEEAGALYGKVIMGGITRLQQFAACAFSHFAGYGLGLKERKEYVIGGLELGSIYHQALQYYAEGLKKDKLKWVDCVGENRELREEKAIEAALTQYDDILSSSKRLEYYRKSILRVVKRTVDIVTRQIAMGEFDVGYVEQAFKHESSLMSLKGVIDRLDIVKKKGKIYIRVIDYKTGKTEFDLELVKAGLQLQLAIYTKEAVSMLKELGEEAEPAGMYYYKIDDPILDSEKDLEKERMKSLRLDGITVDEDEVLGLNDRTLLDEKGNRLPEKSEVIRYGYTTKGTIHSDYERYVLSRDDFNKISDFALKKAGELSGEILNGKIDADPYEYKNYNPCGYCPYRDVCRFDRKLGDSFRKL